MSLSNMIDIAVEETVDIDQVILDIANEDDGKVDTDELKALKAKLTEYMKSRKSGSLKKYTGASKAAVEDADSNSGAIDHDELKRVAKNLRETMKKCHAAKSISTAVSKSQLLYDSREARRKDRAARKN